MGDTALRHCAVLAGEIRKLDVSVEVGTDRKLKRMLELANKLRRALHADCGRQRNRDAIVQLERIWRSGEQETLTRGRLLERFAQSGHVQNTNEMAEVKLDFLGDLRRTHSCGELRASDAGKTAVLMGWVHRRRDLGGVIFIHLRDRDGITQLVFDESKNAGRAHSGPGTELGVCDGGGRHGERCARRRR